MIEINGYRVTMTKDDLDELNGEITARENVVNELEKQLKEAREVIGFYAHDYMFKRSEKEFPNFGASAREYINRYKVKE